MNIIFINMYHMEKCDPYGTENISWKILIQISLVPIVSDLVSNRENLIVKYFLSNLDLSFTQYWLQKSFYRLKLFFKQEFIYKNKNISILKD